MPSKKNSKIFWEWVQKKQAFLALIIALISCGCTLITSLSKNFSTWESSRLRSLIEKEAQAAANRDTTMAVSLFTPNAIIYDASLKSTWTGINQIRQRYLDLPQFTGLAHLDINIESVSFWDGTASAVSTTVGQIDPNSGAQPRVLFSTESWQFKKEDGQWKISGFVINK
jgi:hypothetical protein